MSPLEVSNARLAAQVVHDLGGEVAFARFDEAMHTQKYFLPMNWTAGWGLSGPARKANTDKLCAFTACQLGWLRQTETGYARTDKDL